MDIGGHMMTWIVFCWGIMLADWMFRNLRQGDDDEVE